METAGTTSQALAAQHTQKRRIQRLIVGSIAFVAALAFVSGCDEKREPKPAATPAPVMAPTPAATSAPTPTPTPTPAAPASATPALTPQTDANPTSPNVLDEVLPLMTGSFSSESQSVADPEFFDIRLQMVQIWKGRADVPAGLWLYVEQAQAAALDKPYRQRVYHVTQMNDTTVASAVYEIRTPPPGKEASAGSGVMAASEPPSPASGWAGAWREPARFDAISPKDLESRDGCEVILTRKAPGRFEGGTQGKGCLSTLRGATYATSTAIVTPEGLETWDQGFDAEGKQVWGAVKGGYKFLRVK